MGPLVQTIFYFLYNTIVGSSVILTNYHYAILFFNLIPIYPLDGSKLVNLLLNKYLSFKDSHIVTIYTSFVIFVILMISTIVYQLNLIFVLILLFLLIKVIDEYRKHNYVFNKFLFERYIYEWRFPKNKIIKGDNPDKMCRDYRHLFYINKRYCLEKEILQKKFDFR